MSTQPLAKPPAHHLVAAATRRTAMALEALALEKQLSWVNERDHLSRCWKTALAEGINGTEYRAAEPGERRVALSGFPRVGDVDSLIVGQHTGTVWFELKCDHRLEFKACGYDLVKCATGLAEGRAQRAFLVAAAPETSWRRQPVGAALFDPGDWTAEQVRTDFAKAFLEYERLDDPRAHQCPEPVPDGAGGRGRRLPRRWRRVAAASCRGGRRRKRRGVRMGALPDI